MENWISQSLSNILDFQVPEDLIQYILSIKNESDLIEYMRTLLDFDNAQHKNFFNELTKKLFPTRGSSLPKQQKKKIAKSKPQPDFISPEVVTPAQTAPPADKDSNKGKKKTKFINLYSQEGKNAEVVLLKGRHRCDCQASKHGLINNCLKCGRVVCSQEGSGPCLFCGNLVCTPEEQRQINSKSKSSAKLMESLLERSRPKGWEAALAHRNRLLEYDRTSERRTRVTDDDSDYFNANSVWLSSSEKEKLSKYQQQLHDKKHGSRLNKKITFDFAGRQIIEDNTIEHEVDEELISEITRSDGGRDARMQSGARDGVLSGFPDGGMVGIPDGGLSGAWTVPPKIHAPLPQGEGWAGRVQDAALQELSDTGRCLSMHQPWASLLVDGIKLVEGRSWYTNHRGRLWIASAAKPPDAELIRAVEDEHRALYPDKELKFPSFYPTGCLLGCVSVDDCLPQEEYAKKYGSGDSSSPFVWVCSNPISLRLRFPIKGQHKIFPLEKSIHQAAVKCIQATMKSQAAEANAA